MGEKRADDRNQPSLELPSLSLGLRRRTRRNRGGDTELQDAASADQATEPATVEPGSEVAQPHDGSAVSTQEPLTSPSQEQEQAAAGSPEDGRVLPRRRPSGSVRRSLPSPPVRVATALTGAVVGVAGALATYAAMAGCEAVRGTSSCGGAPGFALLVAIVAVMVLLGGALLRALSVPEPTSTSFLAVGIVVVLVMLFLLEAVFSGWMFLVVPALGAAAYLLSHWVTTRFDDEASTA